MKAMLVNLENQTIEGVEISDHVDIANLIGYNILICDEIGPKGDRLLFDKECFLRGNQWSFSDRFDYTRICMGVDARSSDDGKRLHDVTSDVDRINRHIKYL